MPSAAKDDIIDLTDIVEEGHPETPNLKTAKSSAPTDETLDDLDLEKEIDQIFADLGPPERDGQGNASGKEGEADSDMLNLDGLFEDQGDKAPEASDLVEGTGAGDDSALDFAEDFDKLFGEEAPSNQDIEPGPDATTEVTPQSADEPDWLAELDGLGLDEPKPETNDVATDAPSDLLADISADMNVAPEMDLVADLENVLESKLEPEPAQDTVQEAARGETEETPDVISSVPEETVPDLTFSAQDDPAPVQQATDVDAFPGQEVGEVPAQAALPESFLQRIQELEDRLAALENQEPPQVVVPEPDLDGLLTQVDERIAASPALARVSESQAEALQAMKSRLSAIEQQEPPQPDIDDLLTLVDQRIDERVGSRVDTVQQALDGVTEQVETAAAKIVDAELAKLSESMSADVEQRLRDRLEERLEERIGVSLQGRLEELKASIREDIEQQVAFSFDELKQDDGEQPEDPRIAELAAGLDTLRERIEEIAQNRVADSATEGNLDESLTPMLQEREEHLEARLLDTVRQEMGSMREDWDGQKNTLAKDLENSLNYWTKLQDKFKALQGEWQVLRQDREATPTDGQEAGIAAFSDGWRDELAALLDERLEALREELRRELTDEMDKAVSLAAARIIREEIQAMSQEE
ncbi:hypothetical protein [Desulfonatronum sp. SC1]|uniref:hypothetical protein n=1 Tax=Desulfonatronum sp. SC1 TaxID=2109626 RepID=UPI000D2FC6CE|nr:hypothetical protein [Desulfonatronum sp. SC1]PTN35960.1 hypothetical protein C6366_10445 [Desulfonatronum sp. SC1]